MANPLIEEFLEDHNGRTFLNNGLIHGVGLNGNELVVFLKHTASAAERAFLIESIKKHHPQGAQLIDSSAFGGCHGPAVCADSKNSNVAPFYTGTIAGRVTLGRKRYTLSCNHVLSYNGRINQGTPVLSPGRGDQNDGGNLAGKASHFGWLEPFRFNQPMVNEVDWALADQGDDSQLALTAHTVADDEPSTGMTIHKNGRTTGYTEGCVDIKDLTCYIEFSFGTMRFQNLFGTHSPVTTGANGYGPPFAAPGDSGALVLSGPIPAAGSPQGKALGLLVARAYRFDDKQNFIGYTVFWCSIRTVLAQLSTIESPGITAPILSTLS